VTRFSSASGTTACGRLPEITNGRFVEAKQEKRWLAVRLLCSNPAGRFGSITAVRAAAHVVTETGHKLPRTDVLPSQLEREQRTFRAIRTNACWR